MPRFRAEDCAGPDAAPRADARLRALAEMAGPCGVLADIGCDHGRLGAYMLLHGLCDRAYMTDISEMSLSKARVLIQRLGLSGRASFCVGNGAFALPEAPDAAVIAGMGGQLIAEIIERGSERLGGARLALEPNVAAPELRARLCGCGYRICDERIERVGRRLYVLIAATPGRAEYDERQLTVGPVVLERRPPLLREYAAFRLRVAEKALGGAQRGGDGGAARAHVTEAEIWREFAR